MPSALRIRRLAGLKVDGAPGEIGRLPPFPSLNGLFGTLGLGGKKNSSGKSCRGPGRRIVFSAANRRRRMMMGKVKIGRM